jgi:hypothetical protein
VVDGRRLVAPERAGQPRGDRGRQRTSELRVPREAGRHRHEVQEATRSEVEIDAGVSVVGAIALGGQLAEHVGEARPIGERGEVVGADGHGVGRAYARRRRDDRGVVPTV